LGKFPKLKIIIEHVSSKEIIDFIKDDIDRRLAGTITLHHLILTLDDVLGDGICPHNYCKPVAKLHKDRKAIQEVVLSGHNRFFLGSNSAPHIKESKESSCGCAGCFTSPYLAEGLFEFFYNNNALHLFENFVRNFGLMFYNLKPIGDAILLEFKNKPVRVPEILDGIVPWRAGYIYKWSLKILFKI
jgi:dihydroorotase